MIFKRENYNDVEKEEVKQAFLSYYDDFSKRVCPKKTACLECPYRRLCTDLSRDYYLLKQ